MVNYKTLIIVCLTIVNCGCAKQVIDVNAAQAFTLGNENSVSSTEITSHFFFSDIDIGLNEPIDAAAICHGAENVVRIETEQSWLNSLASGITYGVYTPREARVYCSKKIIARNFLMMNSHKWVLLGACMATLSGCGGSDDNKSTAATSVAPVPHVATTLKAGIVLPQPGVYQTTLLTRDDPHKTLVNFAGLAIVYPQHAAELRWDIWADDGAVATWWLGQAGIHSDSMNPSPLTLTRISRNKVADSAVLTRNDLGAQFVSSNYQRQSSVPSKVMIKTMPVINAKGERVRYSALDLSSTGTTAYHNWNGQVGITKVNTTDIKSDTWSNGNGLATDMSGNTDVTNNDGTLNVVMELPSAGCTLFGKGVQESNHALSKLTFTGFEQCKLVEFNDASWSQSDYKNTAGLAQVKDTATAYIAEFNDANNRNTLVIGFPELDGVIFTLKKG